MAAFLRYRDRTEDSDRERFLAEHEDLRDLLEPMLDDQGSTAPDAPVAAPDPTELQPGRQVGDYQIVREVGRGGMGIVFEAEQISLRRRVALKLLHPHLAWSAGSIQRFRNEAAAAARLRHPAIVPVHEVGEWRGLHYFSMEFVDGRSLHELVHSDHFGVRANCSRTTEAAELVMQVANALQHAHEHKLIHRDVKPHNIMVADDGLVQLLDFGLAKTVTAEPQAASGQFLGTPHYCSPEQVAQGSSVGAGTDVFSLGIVLYELLARRRPFDGATTRIVLDRITAGSFEPLSRNAPSTPRDLQTICHHALETDAAARYASAREFAADLRRFLANEPIHAKPPGTAVRVLKWVRRHRLRVALGSTATLLVVGVPTAYALHQHHQAIAIEREHAILEQAEDLGFQGIEQMLKLISEQLDRQPGLPEQHRPRIDGVVLLCEQFLRLRSQEPQRRARVANALYVTSNVLARIEQDAAGMAACERALAILRTTTPNAAAGKLEVRLQNRRLYLQQRLPPHASSAEFESAISPLQERIQQVGCEIEQTLDYADILITRARFLADQPHGHAEAEGLLRRVLEALPAERRAAHEAVEVRALRANTVLGVLLLATGRPEQALELLAPTDKRLGELPATPNIGVERALATAAIGEAQQRLGQAGAAEQSLRTALAGAAALCAEYPGTQSLRRSLIRTRIRLASLLLAQQDYTSAEPLLREAHEDDTTADSWLDRSLRANADTQLANCILLRSKGVDRDEACELLRGVVATYTTMIDERPDQLHLAHALGGVLNNLAGIANERGEHAEALDLATRAAAQQRRVLDANAKHGPARLFLGMHMSQVALAQAHLGDHEAAIQAALEAIDKAARHTGTVRLAAEAACLCAAAVAADTQEADEYARVAVSGLQQLAVLDRKEAHRWLTSPRFALLSDRADFRQLIVETKQ